VYSCLLVKDEDHTTMMRQHDIVVELERKLVDFLHKLLSRQNF